MRLLAAANPYEDYILPITNNHFISPAPSPSQLQLLSNQPAPTISPSPAFRSNSSKLHLTRLPIPTGFTYTFSSPAASKLSLCLYKTNKYRCGAAPGGGAGATQLTSTSLSAPSRPWLSGLSPGWIQCRIGPSIGKDLYGASRSRQMAV